MSFKCMKCGKCCIETEMPLTRRDISRIESLGYKLDEFAIFNGKYYQLKNINGHCYFLDQKMKCKIYPYRPEGCRIYPVIYLSKVGVTVDEDCPAAKKATINEICEKAKKLIEILREIGEYEEDNK
ncbi:MAG: YkgJ family cysteine cluster protein [Candidatus Verstraetearchaeota archaeon]|nr:YkgJ family cysteine cluster protein [Candidatus Verstraetearchaeota archaeon]